MKRLGALLLLLLAAAPAHASGTRAADTLAHMFTQAGNFGPPPYAADPFTCNATTKRTTYFNTTANTIKFCDGSAWQTVGTGSGGITAGAATSGCTNSTLLWVDSGGLVQCGATVTPTATTQIQLAAGSNTTPVIQFPGATTAGIYSRGTGAVDFASNTTGWLEIASGLNGLGMPSSGHIGWESGAIGSSAQTTDLTQLAQGIFGSGTAPAWFQSPGEGALNANYTNATATFSNTNLSRTVISGRTYAFDLYLPISESTAVDGWQVDFNGGSAAATNFIVQCSSTAETGIIVVLANATSAALATVINATTTVTTGGQLIECHGSFVPSGAGTFILRAAQNTHSTGTLTIKRGATLAMRDSPAL